MKNRLLLTLLTSAVAVTTLTSCESLGLMDGERASVRLHPRSGSNVSGWLIFTQRGSSVRVTGDIAGHKAGPKGFHIHEKGDCSALDAMSAGGHFNPGKTKHGAPGTGHAGDFGNITFDEYGSATVNLMVSGIAVSKTAPNGIIGRSVIIHAQADDLKNDPTGNAGGRVACGVIE